MSANISPLTYPHVPCDTTKWIFGNPNSTFDQTINEPSVLGPLPSIASSVLEHGYLDSVGFIPVLPRRQPSRIWVYSAHKY